jgi:hypothetical protein
VGSQPDRMVVEKSRETGLNYQDLFVFEPLMAWVFTKGPMLDWFEANVFVPFVLLLVECLTRSSNAKGMVVHKYDLFKSL